MRTAGCSSGTLVINFSMRTQHLRTRSSMLKHFQLCLAHLLFLINNNHAFYPLKPHASLPCKLNIKRIHTTFSQIKQLSISWNFQENSSPCREPPMAVSGTDTSTISSNNDDSNNSLTDKLTSNTSFLNLKLYVIIAIISVCVLLVLFLIFLCIRLHRTSRKREKLLMQSRSRLIPLVSKEIVEIKSLDRKENKNNEKEEIKIGNVNLMKKKEIESVVDVEIGQEKPKKKKKSGDSDEASCSLSSDVSSVEIQQDIGWGRWYSLKELEIATRGFAEENVIGEGGYGVVYRGVLEDGSVVAVKNLLNNKGQAGKEFRVEVEAIGKVRHKNLVGLIGYCAEGARRMLVYEYVNNGNLEQWLHGDVGPVSPLTWDIRMNIAIGTAKGLAYLHEGLEPKVVHRDVKSSNILLDKRWNPKVSDFGLAKLLGSDSSYVNTRVMGTFGYVSPDYASTGMLNEGSDVYSFGVLLMELITGRSPIDYSRPPGEMNLVDWFKGMVASRRGEEVLDPLIDVQPSSRPLKRTLLVCLRCIDLDANKRPKMGQIVHMLEADEFPFRAELRSIKDKDPPPSHAASANKIQSKYAGSDDVERLRRR